MTRADLEHREAELLDRYAYLDDDTPSVVEQRLLAEIAEVQWQLMATPPTPEDAP